MSLLEIRPLSWAEGAKLRPLLAGYEPQFPSSEAFEAWQKGLELSVLMEKIAVVGAWESGELKGGLFHSGEEGLASVMGAFGSVEDDHLHALVGHLQGSCEAILYGEDAGDAWSERLAPLGFRPFVRQTFLGDMRRVIFLDEPEDGLELRTWEGSFSEEVISLLAMANAGTLDGLFMTVSRPPSREACQACLVRALSGAEGDFLPWASFVAVEEGAVRGVILCMAAEEGIGLLYELAVHPLARGRKLSRRLLQASERAFLAGGSPLLRFMTTAENTPVQRLFEPEWIVEASESRGGYWLRGARSFRPH